MRSNQLSWYPLEEPESSRLARHAAFSAAPNEGWFWGAADLVYLGDLDWSGHNSRGFEYAQSIKAWGEDGFTYTYGVLQMSQNNSISQSMISEIRSVNNDPLGFEMQIGNEWLAGPLEAWMSTLDSTTRTLAVERYRDIIRWVRAQTLCDQSLDAR